MKLGDIRLIHAGDDARFALIGGRSSAPPTLLRFYVLHCVVIPLAAGFLMAIHFWRVRKDGGISGSAVGLRERRDDVPQGLRQRPLRRVDLVPAPVVNLRLHRLLQPARRPPEVEGGGGFIAFGVFLLVVGLFITPLLYLGIAYLPILFVLAASRAAAVGQQDRPAGC